MSPRHQTQFLPLASSTNADKLDPITIIAIQNAADIANFGLMDVAANHAIKSFALRASSARASSNLVMCDGVLTLSLMN